MSKSSKPYLEELSRRVLIYDGAMGTSLDRYTLTADDFGGEAFFDGLPEVALPCLRSILRIRLKQAAGKIKRAALFLGKEFDMAKEALIVFKLLPIRLELA